MTEPRSPMPGVSLATRLLGLARMGRPLFLVGGFAFHGLGLVAVLAAGGRIDWTVAAWTQLAISAVQLMTHYANEYYDLEADRANPTPSRWAGGSRVLPGGLLPPLTALVAAWVWGALALGATAVLAWGLRTGPWTWPLLGLAWVLGWSYTGPPLKLEYRGLGELTIALVTPGLVPVIGCVLQLGWIPAALALGLVPLMLLELAMSLAINFPDADGDARVGKRTLVVLLGGRRAAGLYAAAVLFAYGLLPLLWLAGLPTASAAAVAAPAPLGVWLAGRMLRGAWRNRPAWDGLCFWSTVLVMGSAGLLGLSFLVTWWTGR